MLTRGAGGSFTGNIADGGTTTPFEFIAEVERDSQDIQRRGLSPLALQNSARTKEEARQLAKAELAPIPDPAKQHHVQDQQPDLSRGAEYHRRQGVTPGNIRAGRGHKGRVYGTGRVTDTWRAR